MYISKFLINLDINYLTTFAQTYFKSYYEYVAYIVKNILKIKNLCVWV